MIDDHKIVKAVWDAVGDLSALADPAKRAQADIHHAQIEQALVAFQEALKGLRQIEAQVFHASKEVDLRRDQMAGLKTP